MRSGGAGGQHVNTTESAVRITHLPTGLAVRSEAGRSQHANRATALRLLGARLAARRAEAAVRERSSALGAQLGTGDRSEKVRTYNYREGRVTDHRLRTTTRDLAGFLAGEGALSKVVAALRARRLRARAEAAVAETAAGGGSDGGDGDAGCIPKNDID